MRAGGRAGARTRAHLGVNMGVFYIKFSVKRAELYFDVRGSLFTDI